MPGKRVSERSRPTCMPLPLLLCESIGVLLTSEGIGKRSLDEELRGVFGRNAAELDSAASTPGVAFDLRPDILRSSSVVGRRRCYEYESSKCTSLSLRASLVCQLTCGTHEGASLIKLITRQKSLFWNSLINFRGSYLHLPASSGHPPNSILLNKW